MVIDFNKVVCSLLFKVFSTHVFRNFHDVGNAVEMVHCDLIAGLMTGQKTVDDRSVVTGIMLE